VADAPVTVVLILSADKTALFPNPVQLMPGSLVKWHCNPILGEPSDESFTITFRDPNPFNVEGLQASVGGTTPEVTVLTKAALGSYRYTITIGATTFDPEIIIEEATPEPRAKTAQAGR